MDKNITIGIEGLVGSGKTSICRELLDLIPNSAILHGGNLYRGIVYALKNSKIELIKLFIKLKLNMKIDIKEIMDKLKVEVKIENRESVVYVNGKKIEEDNLQSLSNSMRVSNISKKVDSSKLYEFGKSYIDEYVKKYNLIISGRDLMKIYPDLDYHLFITASIDKRVERKMSQYNGQISIEELKQHIIKRDELQEQSGYYKIYPNTIKIDVSECTSAKESAKLCLENIKIERRV